MRKSSRSEQQASSKQSAAEEKEIKAALEKEIHKRLVTNLIQKANDPL